jgi:hypothetical protein
MLVSTEVVTVVSDVVDEVVVSSSPALFPHAVNNDTTATLEASANRTDLGALHEVMQPRLPVSAAVKPSSAARDLAGLDTRRARVEALLVAAGLGHGAHGLDVGIPPTAGPAMGVRHRLAEAGALPADIAHGSHM